MSKYFKDSEFECNGNWKYVCNCTLVKPPKELISVLEDVRSHFGDGPVTITSGYRCDKYNSYVGGAKGSKHKEGIAVDIVVKNVAPVEVWEYLIAKYPNQYGIGKYSSFTHIDVREGKARW